MGEATICTYNVLSRIQGRRFLSKYLRSKPCRYSYIRKNIISREDIMQNSKVGGCLEPQAAIKVEHTIGKVLRVNYVNTTNTMTGISYLLWRKQDAIRGFREGYDGIWYPYRSENRLYRDKGRMQKTSCCNSQCKRLYCLETV